MRKICLSGVCVCVCMCGPFLAAVYGPVVVAVVVDGAVAIEHQPVLTGLQALGSWRNKLWFVLDRETLTSN